MPITSEPKGPKPTLPGLMKIQLFWQSNLVPVAKAANVLHALIVPAIEPTQAQLNAHAARVNTLVIAEFVPVVSASWQYNGCQLTMLDGSGFNATATSATVGGTVGGAHPPQVSVGVSWSAGTFWRGGKPRTYLPGIPASATAAGSAQILQAYSDSVETGANAFIAGYNASTDFAPSGLELGLVSYYSRGAFRPTPLFKGFTQAVVHDRLDSQRRRSGKESTFPIS